MRHPVLACHAKKWHLLFQDNNNNEAENSNSFLESRKDICAESDKLDIFLRDTKSGPSILAEDVHEFIKSFPSDTKWQESRQDAWLDERSCGITSSEGVRILKKFLSPAALQQHLSIPRFSHPDMPDADRRIIRIKNFSPAYMRALFNDAVSIHEVSVLRDALRSHIASQTSIRVKVTSMPNPIFQLKLHLPYLALKKFRPQNKVSGKRQKKWKDVSFLQRVIPEGNGQEVYGIYQAHISLVTSGSSDHRWVTYCFDSHDFDDDDEDSEEYEDDESEDGDLEGNAVQDGGYHLIEDPITQKDANKPIWNAREYFLLGFQTQMVRVVQEWKYLVDWIERNVLYYDQDAFSIWQEPGVEGYQAEDNKKTYDWTRRVRRLLSKLVTDLSKTVREWESFNAGDSDIGYFSDFDLSQAASRNLGHRCLISIKDMFDDLQECRQKLIDLQDSCQELTKDLKLRLILQSNEATHDSSKENRQANIIAEQNGVISQLAAQQANEAAKQNRLTTELSIWVIAPFALTTAYFSMPQAVIPFTMTTKSFLATIFAVMVVMRLFLVLLRALRRNIDPSLEAKPMGGTDLGLSRFKKYCRFVLKWKRKRDDLEAGISGG